MRYSPLSVKTFETDFNYIEDDRIVNKIISFINLPEKWNFGEGIPADFEVANQAIKLHSYLKISPKIDSFKVFAIPNSDGGLSLSFTKENDSVILTIRPDLRVDLAHEHGLGEDYEIIHEIVGLDIEKDKDTILTYLYNLCSLSEPYTLKNMTQIGNVSKVTPLPTIMREFPFSRRNAPQPPVKRFAITFRNFTNIFPTPQLSTVNLIRNTSGNL